MKYIIDGYNVVHQIERLKGKRLRSQREGLIALLERARLSSRNLKDLTVVFDGQLDVAVPRPDSAVRVVFSQGSCADEKIGRMLEEASFTRDICVISDDRQVRFYAGSLGAKRIAVRQFLKTVFQALTQKRNHSFKLTDKQTREINQELARIWLK